MEPIRLPAILVPSKIVSVALLILSVAFGVGSLTLGLWAFGMPGIGLTPLIASAILLPVSAILVLQRIEPAERMPLELTPLLCGVGFLAYVGALEYLGFVIPTVAFVLVWSCGVYRRPWLAGLGSAVAITAVIHTLFLRFLAIPLATWPG